MTERYLPGIRVGVLPVDHLDDAHAYHYGYGTYEGDFPPPLDIRYGEASMAGLPETNPRIKLDTGQRVWGYECFWLTKEEFDQALGEARDSGREVVQVPFVRQADTSSN